MTSSEKEREFFSGVELFKRFESHFEKFGERMTSFESSLDDTNTLLKQTQYKMVIYNGLKDSITDISAEVEDMKAFCQAKQKLDAVRANDKQVWFKTTRESILLFITLSGWVTAIVSHLLGR